MEHAEKVAAIGLDQFLVLDQGERSACERTLDPLLGGFLSGAPIFFHHFVPRPVTHERVGGCEIRPCHREVDLRLARRFVLRVEQPLGDRSLLGFQTFVFAGFNFACVEHATSAEETITVFHWRCSVEVKTARSETVRE
jgi:hypothetical protein